MNTEVTFRSTAFNVTEPKDHFINECCFGDDLCRWLIAELRRRGHQTDNEPGQEDFGWYFGFTVEGVDHSFVVSFQPNDPATGDRWLGWVERDCGFLASVIGGRNRNISASAIAVIHEALSSNDAIQAVRWSAKGRE